MSPKQNRDVCPCGYKFLVGHHRSASFLGLIFRDSGKNRQEIKKCPRCGKKLSLNSQGPNPLSIEK